MPQTRTKIRRKQAKLYSAIVLLIALVFVLLALYSTGIALHEWVSFLVIIPLLIHIIIDWQWIVTATKRIFKRKTGQSRFNYYWDWLLFIMFTIVFVSGVLISEAALPAIGIKMEIDRFWTSIHMLTSRPLMMMLGVHIAMHWNWILGAVKPSAAGAPATNAPESNTETNVSSPTKSTIVPILLIVLAAGLVTLAVLPLADAEWAEEFRQAGVAASDEARERPRGIQTTLNDLYWIAIIMGIPALITLSVLRIGKFVRDRRR